MPLDRVENAHQSPDLLSLRYHLNAPFVYSVNGEARTGSSSTGLKVRDSPQGTYQKVKS